MNIKPKAPPRYRILHMFATNLPTALDAALLRPGRIDRMYKVGYPMKDGRARTFHGYFDKIRHTVTNVGDRTSVDDDSRGDGRQRQGPRQRGRSCRHAREA